MANTIKVKPSEINKALMEYLTDYTEDIQEEVETSVTEIAKEARDELRGLNKPLLTGKYRQGWAIKLNKKSKSSYHKIVWNKTDYQLTHLLEFGHVTRKGTGIKYSSSNAKARTEAIAHIRPVEQKYGVKFMDLVEKKIKKRSK